MTLARLTELNAAAARLIRLRQKVVTEAENLEIQQLCQLVGDVELLQDVMKYDAGSS